MPNYRYKYFSRRQFITASTATALSSILLKGCLGNPPEDTPTITSAAASRITIPPEQVPEITKVKLGYLPIVESAPLIIAQEKGFFAKYGMTDVELSKQANWGAARDNIKIGSSNGGIDGGQWQMPMPYLISEGIITDNQKIPMYVLLQLNTQGNGIAIASKHQNRGINLNIDQGKTLFNQINSEGRKFKAAFTFPRVNQEFWIRYWLAANGIDPDTDVELLTVPAAQTVANMKTESMDAFSTGDPNPARIVKDRIGFIAALTAEIWQAHPEEYLGMRADWVDKHPKATKAMLKGIMEAQQWCDNFDNRKELVQIIARKSYFGIEVEVLEAPMMGRYDMGTRQIDNKKMAVLYWQDAKGSVSYPYQSHDLWFLTESVRWGFLPKETLANAQALIKRVNREDIWREAAQEAGISPIPSSTSRGIEEFFDGTKFDPENPQAYLDELKIKNII